MNSQSLLRCRVALGVLGLIPAVAVCQSAPPDSPYAGLETREIKALSAEQTKSYEAGHGMSLALAAELNGYPGPKHVLELHSELSLTGAQLEATEEVFEEMQGAAQNLGRQIVTQEAELDRLFASDEIEGESLSSQVARIAELQGRLRVVHLRAHLEMMDLLSEEQVGIYVRLRGYEAANSTHHHPMGGHDGNR